MPFIGNQPAEAYSSFQKQDFTTSATTSYTLDHPVANGNEIALFINFVRQEPTAAYTASGTSLTLTSATTSSDDMYCVYLGKAVQTVNPPNGSVGLSQLSATGTKDATTFLRGDNTFASAGGDNTPLFDVNLSADQTASDNVATKIEFDTENLDPDNVYDNSTNYRFTVPSGQAGKYLIYGFCTFGSDTGSGNNGGQIFIYKNGSQIASAGSTNHNANNPEREQQSFSIVLDLAVSDYIELYLKCNVTTGSPKLYSSDTSSDSDAKACRFGGYKLIT